MGPLAIKDFVPKVTFNNLLPMKTDLVACQNRFKKELAVIVRINALYMHDVVIQSDASKQQVTVLREVAAKLTAKHPLRMLAEAMHRRVTLGQKVCDDDSDCDSKKDIAPDQIYPPHVPHSSISPPIFHFRMHFVSKVKYKWNIQIMYERSM
jgi:hypothetical protein